MAKRGKSGKRGKRAGFFRVSVEMKNIFIVIFFYRNKTIFLLHLSHFPTFKNIKIRKDIVKYSILEHYGKKMTQWEHQWEHFYLTLKRHFSPLFSTLPHFFFSIFYNIILKYINLFFYIIIISSPSTISICSRTITFFCFNFEFLNFFSNFIFC